MVLDGFKKNYPSSSKTNSSNIQLSDTTGNFKWDWLLWSDENNETKKIVFNSNNQDGFCEHRDKKYPMCTMKYTAVFLCCGPIFLLEVLYILFRHMNHGFYQILTDKKCISD